MPPDAGHKQLYPVQWHSQIRSRPKFGDFCKRYPFVPGQHNADDLGLYRDLPEEEVEALREEVSRLRNTA